MSGSLIKMRRPKGSWRGGLWAEQIALPRTRLGLTLVGLSVMFFGVNFCDKVIVSVQAQQQVRDLQAQINNINANNQRLEQQIAYYGTGSYIYKMSREKYVYRHEGDTVFAVDGPAADPAMDQPPTLPSAPLASTIHKERSWWQNLLGLFDQ